MTPEQAKANLNRIQRKLRASLKFRTQIARKLDRLTAPVH